MHATQLRESPDIQGTVTTSFDITCDGLVAESTASGMHQSVAACIADVVKSIRSPRPKNGGTASATFQFLLKPNGK